MPRSATPRAASWTPSCGRRSDGPAHLARQHQRDAGPVVTFADFRERLAGAGKRADVIDVGVLGRFVVEGIEKGHFVIGHDLDDAGALHHRRADAIARGELPPHHDL